MKFRRTFYVFFSALLVMALSINVVLATYVVTIDYSPTVNRGQPLQITVLVTDDGSPVKDAEIQMFYVNDDNQTITVIEYTKNNGKAKLMYVDTDRIGVHWFRITAYINGEQIGITPAWNEFEVI